MSTVGTVVDPELHAGSAAAADALARLGRDEGVRNQLFDWLRTLQEQDADPARFGEDIRWPVVMATLRDVAGHRVVLADGLVFELAADSRIEKAALLSPVDRPDHLWEPQTTKLLLALARRSSHIVVGGAYIGDQAIPMARAVRAVRPDGSVHAFEPMARPFARLVHHAQLNRVGNLQAHRRALWDRRGVRLAVSGPPALASVAEVPAAVGSDISGSEEIVLSETIWEYAQDAGVATVDLITLDTEGSEERAMRGALPLLDRPAGDAPVVVFEVHRSYTDWSDGLPATSVVQLLAAREYHVFAVRDYHSNHPTRGVPIEVIPADRVDLEGPPHGFNMLAIKDRRLVEDLDLRIVTDVSPKLLLGRDPALHQPLHGPDSVTR